MLPWGGLVIALIVMAGATAYRQMISLRDSQLQRLERKSRTGATLAKLARDPNRFLATIQIGITLAGFLASASAAVSLAKPLTGPLSFLGSGAEPVSIVLYRKNLARAVKSRTELSEQIRDTLLHEIGHLEGLDEDDLRRRGME